MPADGERCSSSGRARVRSSRFVVVRSQCFEFFRLRHRHFSRTLRFIRRRIGLRLPGSCTTRFNRFSDFVLLVQTLSLVHEGHEGKAEGHEVVRKRAGAGYGVKSILRAGPRSFPHFFVTFGLLFVSLVNLPTGISRRPRFTKQKKNSLEKKVFRPRTIIRTEKLLRTRNTVLILRNVNSTRAFS